MTNWQQIVNEEIPSLKQDRNRTYHLKRAKADELPNLVDQGWEKAKEYKNPKDILVRKEKQVYEQYLDQLWMLYANMGFRDMNIGNDIHIQYDESSPDKQQTFQIFAADEETVLLVQCKYSEKLMESQFYSEIKALQSHMEPIRREILLRYPGRKIKVIWACHNYRLSRLDTDTLEKTNISIFYDHTIQYYKDLVRHLGSSARYQLLGAIFAKQEIMNIENRIPAIQGKMGGYTYYSFSIEPEKLLKIGYVLHRSDLDDDLMPTYQRIIKKKRLQEVREFINAGGYFPNSIIISIDTEGRGVVFEQAPTKANGTISKIGIVHIPKKYRSAYIIDGQHRLYGYSDSKYAMTNTVPVVAFIDLARSEQIKMFMDINENQKAVPKTLRVTLNADLLWDSTDMTEQQQALRSKIAQMLGQESSSPLQGRVLIGESDASPNKCITVEAIQAALKKTRLFSIYDKQNVKVKEGIFDFGTNQNTCNRIYPYIERCLFFFRDACSKEWDRGDSEYGILTINRGIQAIIRVIDDVVFMLYERGVVHPIMQTTEDIVEITHYYMMPLAEYINILPFEGRVELRGYFGGGADMRFYRTFQKAISDKRPDYCPDGLNEYWIDESKLYNEDTTVKMPEIVIKLKQIITERLQQQYGEQWLLKGLPQNVYTRIKAAVDNHIYEMAQEDQDKEVESEWDYIAIGECRDIVLHGANWSTLFSDIFVMPENIKNGGNKEIKTEWINKLNIIMNKMKNPKYSISHDDYQFVMSVHEWISNIIVL
jgi:DNA sulfur modification protein DndB